MENEKVVFVGDIVEENGRTIKENNTIKVHNIPIGAMVYTSFTEYGNKGNEISIDGVFYVVEHGRDCDGTPLYSICKNDVSEELSGKPIDLYPLFPLGYVVPKVIYRMMNNIHTGLNEESLAVVDVLSDDEPAL